MKIWNTPSVEDLEAKLTASSGLPSTTEHAGYLQDGWNDPTYDEAKYEDNGDCVIPRKDILS